MKLWRRRPIARGLETPVQAHPVDNPRVYCGGAPTAIHFVVEDERRGRVTFDKLDAIRVCRGEYCPYNNDWTAGAPIRWVFTVDNSPWLVERHAYESRHYKEAYEFGGDVDEMLREFSHYVFRFHDAFVEALAAGIWFEVADESFRGKDLPGEHPLLPLPESTVFDRILAHDLVCQVRKNPMLEAELIANARFCSQPILDLALELDGRPSVHWRLSVRNRSGRIRSVLREYLGGVLGDPLAEFEGVADLTAIRAHVENWMGEVRESRRDMGK